jgi:Cysteine rich repeat
MKLSATFVETWAATLLALACAAPVVARDSSPVVQACRNDHGKFCKAVQPGGGRIAACLQQHEDELAPACRAALGTVSECSAELKKVCGTAANSRSELRECTKAHAGEFSASCRAALAGR